MSECAPKFLFVPGVACMPHAPSTSVPGFDADGRIRLPLPPETVRVEVRARGGDENGCNDLLPGASAWILRGAVISAKPVDGLFWAPLFTDVDLMAGHYVLWAYGRAGLSKHDFVVHERFGIGGVASHAVNRA